MKTISDAVLVGRPCADIGTDHGLIPIHLLKTGRVPFCILCDITDGPLIKASRNMSGSGLSAASYSIRKGDGIAPVEPGEADTVIIAGMGGELIRDIMAADPEKADTFSRFVLQPRSKSSVLRRWLIDNGYAIVNELLAREDRRISQIIVVEHANRTKLENEVFDDELDYFIPPFLYERQNPLLKDFLKMKRTSVLMILENLTHSDNPDLNEKRSFWKQRLNQIDERMKKL